MKVAGSNPARHIRTTVSETLENQRVLALFFIIVVHLNILKSGFFMPFAGIVMLRPCPDTLPCQEYNVLSNG